MDLGAEGRAGGGQVVASGTARKVANNEKSHTGEFLKRIFNQPMTECEEEKVLKRVNTTKVTKNTKKNKGIRVENIGM